jgi:hypothetical protein
MNVGQFRKALMIVENMHRDLGDEANADAIKSFSNLLKGKRTEELSDFAQRIEDARSRLPQGRGAQ